MCMIKLLQEFVFFNSKYIKRKNKMSENKIISSKKELKEWLNYEKAKYGSNKIKNFFLLGESAILRKHQIILRKAEYYANTKKKIPFAFYKIRLTKIQCKHSLHIPLNTCGKGLKIMHLGPILINGNARLGEDCCLHINTALVARGTDDSVPTLGNGVVVGIGSVVVGGVTLADNIAIGACSMVNKSFEEPNIAIAGTPAKKISDNGTLTWNKKEL